MSEWGGLFAVAAALYLLECLVWVRPTVQLCYRQPVSGRWATAAGTELFRVGGRGVALASPFHFRGAAVICRPDMAICPSGLSNPLHPTSIDGSQRYSSFQDVHALSTDEADLSINGKVFARLTSKRLAAGVAAQLKELKGLGWDKRERSIVRAIRAEVDAAAASREWAGFQGNTRTLARICAALFVFTFTVSPVVIGLVGASRSWPYILGGIVCGTTTIAVLYVRSYRKLFGSSSSDLWADTVSILLLPLAAMRSVDRLSREFGSRYNAIALVPVLCERRAATGFLRRQGVDLERLVNEDGSDEAGKCCRWFAAAMLREMNQSIEGRGWDIHLPPEQCETMHSYCPRCHAQYLAKSSVCEDCDGLPLRLFDQGPRAGDRSPALPV